MIISLVKKLENTKVTEDQGEGQENIFDRETII